MPKSRRRKRKTTALKLTPEAVEILKRQREAFRKQFGRDPGLNDPVFFDPDVSTPTSMSPVEAEAETIRALEQAGAPPQVIYAYRKTGLLLVEQYRENWPKDRVAEWDAAVTEYFAIEQAAAAKPEGWDTEIPELIVSGMEADDLEHVRACLEALEPIEESRPMKLAARIELAAYVLVSAMDIAYDSAHAIGHPENAEQLFELAADLVVRRAHELYARGPAE